MKSVHINVCLDYNCGSAKYFVGVFDDDDKMNAAIVFVKNKYYHNQHNIIIKEVEINVCQESK